jgi:stearoyl-CoA desaturase (delta-9 desaturase)
VNLSTPPVTPATTAAALPTWRPKIIPAFFTALLLIHLLALLAFTPYCFVWWGPVLVVVFTCVFGTAGINLGYHRLLTHRALEVPRWLERALTVLGMCSLQGSPIRWVTTHRMHHQHGDDANDPHSPQESFYWGHMQWIYSTNPQMDRLSTFERYSPDLLTDPFYRWLHRGINWVWVYLAHAAVLTGLGYGIGWLATGTAEGALQVGVQVFVWAVVVRTVYVWHATWLVNSAAHRWGYRNYSTDDKSRNNWWVALMSNGEGWHNNHHAAPRSAAHGHRWWEFDVTWIYIWVLRKVGLAWNVVPVKVASYKQMTEEPAPTNEGPAA